MVDLKIPCIWNVNKELGVVLGVFDYFETYQLWRHFFPSHAFLWGLAIDSTYIVGRAAVWPAVCKTLTHLHIIKEQCILLLLYYIGASNRCTCNVHGSRQVEQPYRCQILTYYIHYLCRVSLKISRPQGHRLFGKQHQNVTKSTRNRNEVEGFF